MGKNKKDKQNKQVESNQKVENTTNIEDYEAVENNEFNDDNYVEIAENVMKQYEKEGEETGIDIKEVIVTTTKLRNLLAMISDIYNDVITQGSTEGNSDKLNVDITRRINYLKVKLIYESGRDNSVRKFVDRANISKHLDDVIKSKSKADFILFCRYMEALVAYRKFYFEGDE